MKNGSGKMTLKNGVVKQGIWKKNIFFEDEFKTHDNDY